ncbi:unnamed protein product [Laminaria digitata]
MSCVGHNRQSRRTTLMPQMHFLFATTTTSTYHHLRSHPHSSSSSSSTSGRALRGKALEAPLPSATRPYEYAMAATGAPFPLATRPYTGYIREPAPRAPLP